MKHQYEKTLKNLLRVYHTRHVPTVNSRNYPDLNNHQEHFEFLAAKGLVELTTDLSTNEILIAKLNNSGICYFDEKAEKAKEFWMQFFSQFLVGFVVDACVGIVVPYLTKTFGL